MIFMQSGPRLLSLAGLGVAILAVVLTWSHVIQGPAYVILATVGIAMMVGADLWSVWLRQATWRAVLGRVLITLAAVGLAVWLVDR
ncbi:hypothetical protein K7W42_22350 [Deinococcus sp. HMF7604]|uniref:hypothetical protein n=1 Tax=Deinococcus betulae TaxID=2873312 RepID=UPI001CCDCCE6|nr:hypothetical protein [Deinococcus betulae]MBZ9753576.1 hypothetical protein [Deinococcus betulae]